MSIIDARFKNDSVIKFHLGMITELSEDQYLRVPEGTEVNLHCLDKIKSHIESRIYIFTGHLEINQDTEQLSPNFKLHEFIVSETATRKGIDNTPSPDVVKNLKDLCTYLLEPIRKWARTQNPNAVVRITSGYRSTKLNKAVGGAPNSNHLFGNAADFVIPGVSPRSIHKYVIQNLDFDEAICYSGWNHVAYRSEGNRRRHFFK